jgi:murein DD-endopeptidase MepM/ murein hydrolase activator NlpD
MNRFKRFVLLGAVAAFGTVAGGERGLAREARPERTPMPKVEATPGTVVRWSVPGTKRCGMSGKSWLALQETCYYPIDLEEKPGTVKVSRRGVGAAEYALVSVVPAGYGREEIALGDIPQANPSPSDLRRNAREQAQVKKLWARRAGPARFTLPLGPPANRLPEGKGFGAEWIFNGRPESSELHTGADFALAEGTPVVAAADGTVALAEDLFFAGNAVFIDHGDGLVTMYFHLADLKVRSGQEIRKGEALGVVGSTGRTTGPHLHLGVRWRGARIDPLLLLADPAKIPPIEASE